MDNHSRYQNHLRSPHTLFDMSLNNQCILVNEIASNQKLKKKKNSEYAIQLEIFGSTPKKKPNKN
ncbi:hypothetical protein BpHYR1_024054 [Brachionus plicatilis]|uniref:Uncharacterized protein n=1 Tax=Brachionus plicatilis TaxID=10195 RepID=A0A3M7SIQ3_BRAPC|nr:hypothetical protein BpHYR1_024054 [Brachionus plicatilis]